jgi:carbohydrate diacid regulator
MQSAFDFGLSRAEARLAVQVGDIQGAAETIVERTAELLSASVTLVDDRGLVVASSKPVEVGRPYPFPAPRQVEMPVQLNGRTGRILVAPNDAEEEIPFRLTKIVVDLVVSQATVVDRLPNKREIKNKLIHDLLHVEYESEAAVLREAQVLGMDLSPPRSVLLIGAGEYIFHSVRRSSGPTEGEIWQRAGVIVGAVVDFFELPADTICAYIGNGDVAVLKASNPKNLGQWAKDPEEPEGYANSNPSWANLDGTKRAANGLLVYLRRVTRRSLSIGIGRYHPGLRGLASSYADARAALSLGRRLVGNNRVHCLDSLGVAAFVGVSDEQTKIDLSTHLLSPLDHEPDLLQTIDGFFANNCVPSATARALCIHRNTLAYRMDKIASLTGLDPRKFEEAVQIRLALTVRALQGQRAS